MLAAFLTTVLFAITAVFARRAAQLLGPVPANFWRLVVAAAILGGWSVCCGRGWGAAGDWFFASGLVGFGLGGLLMFQALPRAGANLATLAVQCGAAVVALGAERVWLGMAVSWQQQVCIAAILIGVLVGMAPGSLPQYSPRRLLLGGVLALLSAVGQGVGQVLSRKAYQVVRAGGISVDSATVTFERVLAGLLAAGVALAVVRLWASRRNQVQDTAVAPQASAAAWPWVLLNSLTGPVLGVTCLQWALSQPSMSAGITQSIVATAPLLTAPLAWRLGGELLPRLRYFAGAVLAVAGTASLALQWWK